MYDIHCHILPGVDDGSNNLSESVQMAKLAEKAGTKGIIVTPHANFGDVFLNYYDEEYLSNLKELKKQLAENNVNVELYCGQEIYCSGSVITLLNEGKLITLNHSRYLLIEFNMKESQKTALKKAEQLVSLGYTPIIAHPERYSFADEDIDSILRLKKSGCLIQLNKGSLEGDFGKTAFHISKFLISRRIADFIASDAHTPYFRTSDLGDCHEYISENYSMDYADYLLINNPLSVIEDKSILKY